MNIPCFGNMYGSYFHHSHQFILVSSLVFSLGNRYIFCPAHMRTTFQRQLLQPKWPKVARILFSFFKRIMSLHYKSFMKNLAEHFTRKKTTTPPRHTFFESPVEPNSGAITQERPRELGAVCFGWHLKNPALLTPSHKIISCSCS